MSCPRPRVAAIVPVLNEEGAIGAVIHAIPQTLVDDIIVVDGGSCDRTVAAAREAGARVVCVGRGYGRACAAGAVAATENGAEILVFLDGDGSDRPEAIAELLAPIREGEADFVIASRTRGPRESGSMAAHQILAGWMIGLAIRALWDVRYSDMAAFRAIRAEALARLGMREMTYGWNLEMQMRAARIGLRVREVPLAYYRRVAGRSKVAGNLVGSVKAGLRIAATFFRCLCEKPTDSSVVRRS